MTLVKLGHILLNLDLATSIRDPGGVGSPEPLMVEFGTGQCLEVLANADTLRSWLAANSTDITPTSGSSAS